jgi:hypothetical protein
MNTIKTLLFLVVSLGASIAQAQLAVTVSPVMVIGQKVVVPLAMTNNLAGPVASARAVCFLLDEQGTMIGQSTKWVIGGTKDRPALQPNAGTTFNFVITGPQRYTTTNLTAQVSFSRLVLDGEKLANPKTDVQIQNRK